MTNSNQTEPDAASIATHDARVSIENENYKGLLIINGGGSVALLAFLQAIWGSETGLEGWIIFSLLLQAFGLSAAILHQDFRYQGSKNPREPKWGKWKRYASYVSLLLFVCSIVMVALGGFSNLPGKKSTSDVTSYRLEYSIITGSR